MPDGQPQSSLVWCDYDGTHVRVNITRERQKGKNVQADPRVSLLVIDPEGRLFQAKKVIVQVVGMLIKHGHYADQEGI